jgi:hypothetical protein
VKKKIKKAPFALYKAKRLALSWGSNENTEHTHAAQAAF